MAILTDGEIKELQGGERPILESGYNPGNVNDFFIDLTVDSVVRGNGTVERFELSPGSHVFVKTAEIFDVPKDCVVFIHERTSAVRLGLGVSGVSPLKPGFRGCAFIRIANLSDKAVAVEKGFGVAQACVFRTDREPERTYDRQEGNHFQGETAFRGLGGYESEYSRLLSGIEKEKDGLEKLQGRIYANMVAILGVFAAIIALLVTNVQAFSADKSLCQVVMINADIIASVIVMMVLVRFFLGGKK